MWRRRMLKSSAPLKSRSTKLPAAAVNDDFCDCEDTRALNTNSTSPKMISAASLLSLASSRGRQR